MKQKRSTSSDQPLRRRIRGWVGVVSTAQGVEFAVARAESGQARVERQDRVATLAEMRSRFDPREYRVITGIGAEDVLCRTLRLPTAAPTELKQMLDLQLDQLTPLPPEEVVYDFEPLDVREGQTQVLVAIARKSAVNERIAALEAAGITAEIVGLDVVAMFRGLLAQNALARDDKLGALVSLHPGGAVVVLYTQGQPLVVRSIVLGDQALSAAEARAALREELQRTLLAERARDPKRERGPVTFLVPDENLREAAESFRQEWGATAECLVNGAAPRPATSLCTDQLASRDRRLNLLPEEWRRRRQAARHRRLWWRVATVLIGAYLLAAVVGTVVLGLRKSRLNQLQATKIALEPQFREARQLHSELNAMRLQLETKYSALDVLRQVSELMPPNLKLTSFVFRRDEAITLKGQSDNAQAVLDFISRLEQNELFSNVKTVSMPTERAGGLTKFELLATLKSAAGKQPGGGAWR